MHTRRNVIAALVPAVVCLIGGLLAAPASSATSTSENPPDPAGPVHNVMNAPYNAAGDGTSNDRTSIQQALDDTAAQGGGTVLLPAGHTFLSGSLTVGSNTSLEIDGTLLQSQNPADYSYTPIAGHNPTASAGCASPPGLEDCPFDLSIFHNLPLIYAAHQHDVAITGRGTIQMTQSPLDDPSGAPSYVMPHTIYLTPIGFYRVSDYQISDLNILGSLAYNISLFTTDHGLIQDANIDAFHTANVTYPTTTDGVDLMNSQHIRITGLSIRNNDDGIVIWESYRDQRSYVSALGGQLWWSSDDPQPSTDIEIDHNTVEHGNGHGVAFIPWGTGAPDPREVTTSDVRINDNTLTTHGHFDIGCWCDNPWTGSVSDQSPITGVRIYDNVLNGNQWEPFIATDLKTDGPLMSSGTVLNGDFEDLGTAWWSTKGDTAPQGDVGATDASNANVLRIPAAQAALSQMDGWAGYLQPRGDNPAKLYQGLGLHAGIPGVPFDTGTFQLSADVVTGPNPVRLFAYDTCTQQTLAERSVIAAQVQHESLTFHLSTDCDDVQVGIERGSEPVGNIWALIDNVSVTNTTPAIDNTDPSVTYSGDWHTYNNIRDWGGTNATALAAGATVTIPFAGTRAAMLAITDHNLGMADVYLDGTFIKTVDYYTPTQQSNVIFDTGDLAPGNHTIELITTGTKNPASAAIYTDFDALLVEQ